MNLQLIKNIIEKIKYPGGLNGLANDIGMSVQNLHRCVRENKIQAQDLEKIAALLNVPINTFFDSVEFNYNVEFNSKRLGLNINLIKRRMESLHMTKRRLCESTGLARTTFDAILNGSDARISTLEMVAKALNLKICNLFDETHDSITENSVMNVSCDTHEQIAQLKSQLADKEKIIRLLENTLSLCSQKN